MSQRDEIQRAYLKWGPYQIQLENYPFLRKNIQGDFNLIGLKFYFLARVFCNIPKEYYF